MKTLLIILASVLMYSCNSNDDDSSPDTWAGTYHFISATSSDPSYTTGGCDISIGSGASFSISNTCLNPYVTNTVVVSISGNSGSIPQQAIADHWTLNAGTIVRSGNTLTASYSITIRNLDGSIHGNPHFTNTYRK